MRLKYRSLKKRTCKSRIGFARGSSLLVVITITLLMMLITSCKKNVEVNGPATSTNADNVYASDGTAAAVLTGVYAKMSSTSFPNGGITGLSLYLGLSADELILYSGVTNTSYIQYYTNALVADNSTTSYTDFWYNLYPYIFIANSAIQGLTNSTTLTPAIKQQLIGEAKFIRAFCYFYLVNLYGDVPLVTGIDYTVNAAVSRTPKVQVWQQIISDLKDAQSLLNTTYLKADAFSTTTERVRPTKWAATALLARSYLYTSDWVNAEGQATSVINNVSLYNLNTLNSVFLKNSTEAIWQLQPVLTGYNAQDARTFIIPATGLSSNGNPVYLNNYLLNSFEIGDQRKANWINSITIGTNTYYYPYKYKVSAANAPVTEYLMVLRLGEQYLIRAEARAQQGNTTGAAADLNTIRTRSGLLNTTATTQSDLTTAIQREREVELFTEWGHRWLDLKRTGTVDAVMGTPGGACAAKGGSWSTYRQWYPIVLSELQRDANLVQNAGY